MSAAGRGAVAALVVSHDGARWLPLVIDGLRAQTRAPDHVVCVDTGSRDEGPDLLEAAFGAVRSAPAGTSYPEAVRLGLAEVGDVEWLWLLHDDSTPAPDALAQLLAAAQDHPEADLLGPKLREWPSLRRLLEVGVTISGTGRRETGLERGEYDQGQHDEVRRVLAVNSAGMLVRREAFEALGGFDDQLPVFGNDLDLGWRAAAAGRTTLVVPQAVVFHAEAAHRGVRRTPLTGRHTHFQERRAALFTLLVNSPGRTLPLQVVRLTLGTLLRVLGFLLVRSPGEALDELAALVSLRPRSLMRARRERAGRGGADVRRLLAPWWLPYRHGLDLVGGVVAAAGNQAADVAERRRIAAAERDPESFAARRPVEEDDVLEADSGWVARFLSNPVAVLLALVVLVSLVGARAAFGPVTGGALSPAPQGVGDWWRLHLESWHPLGAGTAVPAPPYLLPMALLGTLLGGSATAAVSAVMLLAVPVSLWGAWRLLGLLGRLVSPRGLPRWLLLWGAVAYALVPATSGAWGQGRLGVVAAVAVLPWLVHAAVGFADP
ncbi:glycosyltransferase family 2 protein, partial [uncultured Nocardioides sp.]|uniref:glycosyltransferase family 2 protein n=1 Tax=uncultured Nocardioides sp. TaxID=198441 RepID=UPI00261349D2